MAIFAHRARQAIGAAAATLGGVDALVFTGGIGEHSAEIRAAVCEGLSCVGLEIDLAANATAQPDTLVSTQASPSAILVVAAREDLMMARAARASLAHGT
jgi:acetate kinase